MPICESTTTEPNTTTVYSDFATCHPLYWSTCSTTYTAIPAYYYTTFTLSGAEIDNGCAYVTQANFIRELLEKYRNIFDRGVSLGGAPIDYNSKYCYVRVKNDIKKLILTIERLIKDDRTATPLFESSLLTDLKSLFNELQHGIDTYKLLW